jgi:hypothetical protein
VFSAAKTGHQNLASSTTGSGLLKRVLCVALGQIVLFQCQQSLIMKCPDAYKAIHTISFVTFRLRRHVMGLMVGLADAEPAGAQLDNQFSLAEKQAKARHVWSLI